MVHRLSERERLMRIPPRYGFCICFPFPLAPSNRLASLQIDKTLELTIGSGESEYDEKAPVWETLDWEEWNGDQDTDENRGEWPTGFKWSCCGMKHDADPCRAARHRDATGKLDKADLTESDSDGPEEY